MENQAVGINSECILRDSGGRLQFVNNPAFPTDPRIGAVERCNAGGHDAADLLLLENVPVFDIAEAEHAFIVFEVRF